MKNRLLPSLVPCVVVFALAFAACGSPSRASAQPILPAGADDYAPGQLLIKFRPGAAAAHLTDAWQRAGLGLIQSLRFRQPGHPGITHASTRLSVPQALRVLQNHPAVEYAEPNYRLYPTAIPSDPLFRDQWGLHNTGQIRSGRVDADIDAPEAWDITTGDPDMIIGVIDTGIDISHPDLAAGIWVNPDEIPNDGIDNDGNGYVDDVHGWDFWHGDNSVFDPADGELHGTHVAGIVGARAGNGIGIVGVNWRARIMPLKFSGPDVGYFSMAIAAVNYAADKGVKVLNGSFGRYSTGPGDVAQGLRDAIQSSGILFVAAAGNDANDNDATPFYPASYDLDLVIAVAATDHKDQKPPWSSYGATSVDLGAPGAAILSTAPGGGYEYLGGTSMATPHVTGVAGLVYARFPGLTPLEVKSRILNGVDPLSALAGKCVTGGRLNAARALAVPALPPIEVFVDDFGDTDLAPWTQDAQNAWLLSGESVVVDGPATDAQLVSSVIDLQGRTAVTISFSWIIGASLDVGEYLAFDVSIDGGAVWTELARNRGNKDPEGVWRNVIVEVPSALAGHLRLRFRGRMNGADEAGQVDAVLVTAH